jgi:hypothetical protein
MTMRDLARFAAPTGLLLLVGGGIAYNIRPDLKAWIGGILVVGAALILVSLYRSFALIKAWLDRRSTRVGFNVALMTLLLLAWPVEAIHGSI